MIAHHPMLDSSWQKTSNLHQNHGITTITAAVRGGLPLPPMPNALGVPYARQEGYTFTARFDDGHIEKKRHLIRHPREPISPFNLNGFPNGQYDGESLRLYRGKGMEVPSSLSGEVLMRVEQPYVIDEGPFRSDMVLNYGYGGDRSVQIRGYRILEGGKRLKLTVSRKIPVTVFHRDRDEVLIAVSRIREITAFQRRTGVLHEPAESIQVFLAPEGVVLTPRWVEGASVGLFGTNIIARFEVPFDVEREGLRRSR
ncbi:hypothetical protein [Sulfidibacter corallicola]|uniref:Uncharacterized protein n=1 Tax=Sulfidibacter corallicola TaxID=2818388 RepID=A0A8A4TLN7_SULCO|nr:hypothetical protein [Sulfidibacter corallicola]QTD50022.1 hypothetical protein J3U87_30940 [Sulfidibacter corallicola]